jgi:hypothetical protein
MNSMKTKKILKRISILSLVLLPVASFSLTSCSKKPVAYLPISVVSNLPNGDSKVPYNIMIKPTAVFAEFKKSEPISETYPLKTRILVDFVNNGSSFTIYYANSFLKHACSTKEVGTKNEFSEFCRLLSNDSSIGNKSQMYSAYKIEFGDIDFIKTDWTKENPYTLVRIDNIKISYREYIAEKNSPDSSLSYIQSDEHKNPEKGYSITLKKSLLIRQKMKDTGNINEFSNDKVKYLESLESDSQNKFLFIEKEISSNATNTDFNNFKNVSLTSDKNNLKPIDSELFYSIFSDPQKI